SSVPGLEGSDEPAPLGTRARISSGRLLPANRFCRLCGHGSVLVDRDDLALAAVQTDSLEQTGDNTRPRDDRLGVGAALQLEAVRAARGEIGIESLPALVTSVAQVACPDRLSNRSRSLSAPRTADQLAAPSVQRLPRPSSAACARASRAWPARVHA